MINFFCDQIVCVHICNLLLHNEAYVDDTNIDLGGRNCVAVEHPHCNGKDVGSNPAATRNENGHWDGPLHRMCPNVPT